MSNLPKNRFSYTTVEAKDCFLYEMRKIMKECDEKNGTSLASRVPREHPIWNSYSDNYTLYDKSVQSNEDLMAAYYEARNFAETEIFESLKHDVKDDFEKILRTLEKYFEKMKDYSFDFEDIPRIQKEIFLDNLKAPSCEDFVKGFNEAKELCNDTIASIDNLPASKYYRKIWQYGFRNGAEAYMNTWDRGGRTASKCEDLIVNNYLESNKVSINEAIKFCKDKNYDFALKKVMAFKNGYADVGEEFKEYGIKFKEDNLQEKFEKWLGDERVPKLEGSLKELYIKGRENAVDLLKDASEDRYFRFKEPGTILEIEEALNAVENITKQYKEEVVGANLDEEINSVLEQNAVLENALFNGQVDEEETQNNKRDIKM